MRKNTSDFLHALKKKHNFLPLLKLAKIDISPRFFGSTLIIKYVIIFAGIFSVSILEKKIVDNQENS